MSGDMINILRDYLCGLHYVSEPVIVEIFSGYSAASGDFFNKRIDVESKGPGLEATSDLCHYYAWYKYFLYNLPDNGLNARDSLK